MTTSDGNLELQVEQAVRSGLTPVEATEDALQTATSSRGIGKLFRKMSSVPELKKLLFLHRYDLFAVEEEVQLPFFYISSLATKEGDTEEPQSRTLEHVVDDELERTPDTSGGLQGIPLLDSERGEELSEDLTDVLVYFLIRWLQQNPQIVELAQQSPLSYEELKKVLRDPEETLTGQIIPEAENVLEGEDTDIDPAIERKIERVFMEVIQIFFQLIEGDGQSGAGLIPDIAISLHKSSHVWLRRILRRSSLELEGYQVALNELYRLGLITNRDTIFWCERCGLDEPSYTEHHGRVPPERLSSSECLRCGDTDSYGAVYKPSDEFKETLLAKDGLLAVFFGWSLDAEGVDYELSQAPGGSEADFIVAEDSLVEVKMLKGGRDDLSKKSQLESALGQLNKQVANLEDAGRPVEEAFLLWNQWDIDQEQTKRILRKHDHLEALETAGVLGPQHVEGLADRVS